MARQYICKDEIVKVFNDLPSDPVGEISIFYDSDSGPSFVPEQETILSCTEESSSDSDDALPQKDKQKWQNKLRSKPKTLSNSASTSSVNNSKVLSISGKSQSVSATKTAEVSSPTSLVQPDTSSHSAVTKKKKCNNP